MVCTQESYHKLVKYDHPGECSPEKDCLWWHWLIFWPERNSSSESSHLTLIVSMSVNVTTNSHSQEYTHPDDHTSRTYGYNFKEKIELCLNEHTLNFAIFSFLFLQMWIKTFFTFVPGKIVNHLAPDQCSSSQNLILLILIFNWIF